MKIIDTDINTNDNAMITIIQNMGSLASKCSARASIGIFDLRLPIFD
jgi:hypothetical protein